MGPGHHFGSREIPLAASRMKVHNALTSGLQPKSSEKSAHFDNFCAHENSANLKIRERNRVGTVRVTPLQECFDA